MFVRARERGARPRHTERRLSMLQVMHRAQANGVHSAGSSQGASHQGVRSRQGSQRQGAGGAARTLGVRGIHGRVPDNERRQGTMHQRQEQRLSRLRRPRHRVSVRVQSRSGEVGAAKPGAETGRMQYRPHRQRRALRARQPAVGDSLAAGAQQKGVPRRGLWSAGSRAALAAP